MSEKHIAAGESHARVPVSDHENDPAFLWGGGEIHHLRAEVKGPEGFATWKDAAMALRLGTVRAAAASAESTDVCGSCNGVGVVGTPGAKCPFCPTHKLGLAYRELVKDLPSPADAADAIYRRMEADRAALESSPDDIRALGWSVAVHNDYRLNGVAHTFWLFTKGDRALRGEGLTDAQALNAVRAEIVAKAKEAP